ncbi:uncharacterized protein [Centroberyx affinis]|uniref:uncharacterized protein n=1 Tax=Centroberyx affinis TaxID=166261 RepID=UPI003A5BAB4A
MVDRGIRLEVLSVLSGNRIEHLEKSPKTSGKSLTVDDFHISTILGRGSISNKYESNLRVNVEELFDPRYDFDFTSLTKSVDCVRGDESYQRPLGWYRMALKVKDKYPDGNTWLGPDGWRSSSAPGEWPVSYHGTSLDGAKGIITSHYKAGSRAAHGRGIYSTPKLDKAEKLYAKTFKSKTNGKTYKVIMQNRINPCQREKPIEDTWLIPVARGLSDGEEREIVEESIRPYGILIKEVQDPEESSNVTSTGNCTTAPKTPPSPLSPRTITPPPVTYSPPAHLPTRTSSSQSETDFATIICLFIAFMAFICHVIGNLDVKH